MSSLALVRNSRLAAALSIPLGFVLGHVAAYTLASGGHGEVETAAHGYLESLSKGAVPMGLCAILIAVLQGRRGEELRVRASSLIGQLVGVYVAIEVTEHLAVGVPIGKILTEKTLFVGIAVQLAIGLGLCWLLRAVHRVGELLSETPHPSGTSAGLLPTPVCATVRSSHSRSSKRPRGPPAFAFASSW